MHVFEGTVDPRLVWAGLGVGAGLAVLGVRRVSGDEVPRLAVLTAAFFVSSSISVPLSVSSLHLLLTGFCGFAPPDPDAVFLLRVPLLVVRPRLDR